MMFFRALLLTAALCCSGCLSLIHEVRLNSRRDAVSIKKENLVRMALSRQPADEAQDETSTEGRERSEEPRIYFDIAVGQQDVGRLVFNLSKTYLPEHTENILKLCSQERCGIDPRCSYVGCEFRHSPQFVEGLAQYRWAHVLDGRGINAVGRGNEALKVPQDLNECTHQIYGGNYYGLQCTGEPDEVLLTVPLVGPGRGSTSLSIVRVGESPREWKERLLLNSAVLGRLVPSSLDTLHSMARQTQAPPKVTGSGVL